MKKVVLSIICVLFLKLICFATDDCSVTIEPVYQIPGGMEIKMDSPALPTGLINLKYNFIVNAEDKEYAFIDCVVKFSKDMDIKLLSNSGIQAMEIKDDSIVKALGGTNIINLVEEREEGDFLCFEFFIPHKKDWRGSVEFQANINIKSKGEYVHVDFAFFRYENSMWNRWGKYCIPSVGVVLLVIDGVSYFVEKDGQKNDTATISPADIKKTIIHKFIERTKDNYSYKNMLDSFKHYTLQIL